MVAYTITLQDSGYRQTGSRGLETVKANSGTAVTLTVSYGQTGGSGVASGVYSIKRSHKPLLGDDPQPNKYTSDDSTKDFSHGEVDQIGVDMPKWTIRGRLDLRIAADQTLLGNLCKMVKTKGVKFLATTNDSSNPIMIRWSDETAVTSLNVRIANFDADQDGNDVHKVKYTLELIETA